MPLELGRRQLLLAGLALCWPRSASAGRKEVSLETLLAHSDCCVIGRPIAAQAEWMWLGGARRIVTSHRVVVSEVLDGDALPGQELRVRTLGGVVGDVMQRVSGQAMLVHERPALFFLVHADAETHVLTDMEHSYFPIEAGTDGVERLSSTTARVSPPALTPEAIDVLGGARVEDARAMLRETAWRMRAR